MDSFFVTVRKTLRHDRVLQTVLIFFGVAVVGFLSLDLPAATLYLVSRRWLPLFFQTLALAALWAGAGTLRRREERRFWRELSVAFACWWIVSVLYVFHPGLSKPLWVDLLAEVLFAGFFIRTLMTIERRPDRPAPARPFGLERALTWPLTMVFVGGLFAYFVIVPLVLDPEEYATALSSLALYVTLDLYVLAKLIVLLVVVRDRRWRTLYALLTLAIAAFTVEDCVVTWTFYLDVVWPWMTRFGFLWLISWVLLTLAARARHHAPERSARAEVPEGLATSRLSFPGPAGRTLISALAVPFVHFLIYSTDVLHERSEGAREVVVCVWLFLLGALALLQHYLLERRARELWLEQRRAEQALRQSEKDLRLILERKHASEELEASQERFFKVFQSSPDAISISTLDDGRFVEVNEAFTRLTGIPGDEVIGRTAEDLGFWPSDASRSQTLLSKLDALGKARDVEIEITTRQGDRRIFQYSAEPLDFDGQPCLLVIAEDVTERRQADDRLRAQADVLALAEEAICQLDLDGRLVFWNSGAERLFGWPAVEVLGRRADDVFLGTGETPWPEIRRRVVETGGWSGRLHQRTHRGEEVVVDSRWTALRGADGAPRSCLVFASEVAGS